MPYADHSRSDGPPSSADTPLRRVGFPLYPGATLLDFTGATEVFAFSGLYQPLWLALEMAPITTSEGMKVLPDASFAEAPPLDLLFVPGGETRGVIWAMNDPHFQQFIKRAAAQAEWYGSVCVGAFILAAAGLLDGHSATTYWSQLDNLNLFPAIQVATDQYPRYCPDPISSPFSGGGVSASIDLALAIVRQRDGEEAAQRAQLRIQYAPNPPVQAGDPSQAPPALVDSVRHDQERNFILPMRIAVEALLHRP